MTQAYDEDLQTAIKAAAACEEVPLHSGVYMWFSGPSFETPAEIRMARALGADLVIAVNVNERTPHPGKRRYALPSAADEHGFWDRLRQRWTAERPDTPNATLPSILGISADALNIMQNRVMRARLAGDPADVLLSPRVGHIGLFEFNRAAEAIDEGRRSAERHLEEIRELWPD